MEKKNEELIELLHQKLEFYTYEAKEEEFNADEVDSICVLLDTLEPVEKDFSMQTSYENFKEKYMENNERKIKKKRYSYPKIAIGAAMVCMLVWIANLGSYATKEKGFFDILKKDTNEIEIITAGMPEKEIVPLLKGTYENWEEVQKQLKQRVLMADGLPAELENSKFTVVPFKEKITVYAEYFNEDKTKYCNLKIDLYDLEVMKTKVKLGEIKIEENGKVENLIMSGKEVSVVYKEEQISAYFTEDNGFYLLSGNLNDKEMRNILELTLKK